MTYIVTDELRALTLTVTATATETNTSPQV